MPVDAAKFIINFDNQVNAVVTAITFVESAMRTSEVEPAWKQKKDKMCWTIAGLTQPVHDSKKLKFANGMFPKM
eukprot:5918403-Pyramimonas_sp.AAC.1